MLNPTELTAMLTDKISRAVDGMPPEMHCGVPNLRELLLRHVPDMCQDIQDMPIGEIMAECLAECLAECPRPEASSEIATEFPFAQLVDEYVRSHIDGFITGYRSHPGRADRWRTQGKANA